MVLNLMRVPDINPKFMLERSFFQFQNQSALPGLLESESSTSPKLFSSNHPHPISELHIAKDKLERCHVAHELEIAGYMLMEKQLETLKETIRKKVFTPKNLVPCFQIGRMLKVSLSLEI